MTRTLASAAGEFQLVARKDAVHIKRSECLDGKYDSR